MLSVAMLLILFGKFGRGGHCIEINSQKSHEKYLLAKRTLIDLIREMTAMEGSVG
jgi:hypothetical protein